MRTRTKMYGLFAVTQNCELRGFIEHSFSMGWDESRVRVWDKESAQAYLEQFQKDKELSKTFSRFFLVRANSKNAIAIQMAGRNKANGKFDWRNRPFKSI